MFVTPVRGTLEEDTVYSGVLLMTTVQYQFKRQYRRRGAAAAAAGSKGNPQGVFVVAAQGEKHVLLAARFWQSISVKKTCVWKSSQWMIRQFIGYKMVYQRGVCSSLGVYRACKVWYSTGRAM